MKKAILSITLASIILLCSCGSRLDEPLPSNASAFEYATFENPVDPNDTYIVQRKMLYSLWLRKKQ